MPLFLFSSLFLLFDLGNWNKTNFTPWVLVNNAGDGNSSPLMEATPEQLEESFALNVYGSIYLTQAVVSIGKMPRGGRIINIGTIASKLGLQGPGVYSAAKAAQDSLTASWAGEVTTLCSLLLFVQECFSNTRNSLATVTELLSTRLHPVQFQPTRRSNSFKRMMGPQPICSTLSYRRRARKHAWEKSKTWPTWRFYWRQRRVGG